MCVFILKFNYRKLEFNFQCVYEKSLLFAYAIDAYICNNIVKQGRTYLKTVQCCPDSCGRLPAAWPVMAGQACGTGESQQRAVRQSGFPFQPVGE